MSVTTYNRAEEDFPRGGEDVITPLEKRSLHFQAQQDVLFGKVRTLSCCNINNTTPLLYLHVCEVGEILPGNVKTYMYQVDNFDYCILILKPLDCVCVTVSIKSRLESDFAFH